MAMKVFTYENLVQYDNLLKNYISTEDAKSLKTVTIVGNTVNFYREEEPLAEGNEAPKPAYSIELPETDISGLIEKMENATEGNVVIANADGTVADGGVALTDLAKKSEVEAVDGKANKNAEDIAKLQTDKANAADVYTKEEVDAAIEASEYNDTTVKADIQANKTAIEAINNADTGILKTAQNYADTKVQALADGAVKANTDAIAVLNGDESTEGSVKKAIKESADAINATIGDVEEGKTVVGMIEEVIADAYDDTEVRGLIADNAEAIEAHKTAIDDTVTTLVGEDTGKSVRTIANEELAAQLIGENAKESLNTLEEIAAWIQSHPDDASAMNKAIEDLEALVGTLPEGITATTVVGYVQELVNAEKSRAEGVESGLNTRLETVETAIGENGSVTAAIADAKKAGTDASAAVTALADGQVATNKTNIEALQTLVGDGYEAIPEADIQALFTTKA